MIDLQGFLFLFAHFFPLFIAFIRWFWRTIGEHYGEQNLSI
jgi:hypothetical protein